MNDDQLWIARDEDGYLAIYYDKPKLGIDEGCKYWKGRLITFIYKNSYPDVTFENSPIRLVPDFIENLKPII